MQFVVVPGEHEVDGRPTLRLREAERTPPTALQDGTGLVIDRLDGGSLLAVARLEARIARPDAAPPAAPPRLLRLLDDHRLPLQARLTIARDFALDGRLPDPSLRVVSHRPRHTRGRHRTATPTRRPASSGGGTRPSDGSRHDSLVRALRAWADSPRHTTDDSSVRDEVATDRALYAAWERVRDNAMERGSWNRDLETFEDRLTENIVRLRTELQHGTWAPGTPRLVRIPKDDGGQRTLHIPPVVDRVVERALATELARRIDPLLSPWSFAYRPGRSRDDVLQLLVDLREEGMTHVARFDVRDCFPSLDRDRLLDAFERCVDDEWARAVVAESIDRDLHGVEDGDEDGIAQGSPLSPLLANVALDELDRAMLLRGYPALRYADDLAVPATSERDAHDALRAARLALTAMGLELRSDKSRVTAVRDGVRFVGHVVGRSDPPSDLGVARQPPQRRSLYLTTDVRNAYLRKGQVVAKDHHGEDLLQVPVSKVGRIVLFGPVGFSGGLRAHCLYNGIDVTFLSRRGRWLGSYETGHPRAGLVRREQYRLLDDVPGRRRIARELVAGKILNQRALLQRYARRDSGVDVSLVVDRLRDAAATARAHDGSLAQLHGIEGAAARDHFSALGQLLPEEARFDVRSRRPPRDAANAALSFLYTVLMSECHGALAALGLDVAAGVLHEPAHGRPALACDLVEELRPLVVDTVVVGAFRRGQLQVGRDFRRDGDAVLLNRAGRRSILEAYERRMLRTTTHTPSNTRMTVRELVTAQARALRDAILLDGAAYEAVRWR